MKVVAKEIEMIGLFSKDGIKPLKFRYENDNGELAVIKIDKIISKSEERYCGNRAIVFDCQSEINGMIKLYQLKYFIAECKWLLFKI